MHKNKRNFLKVVIFFLVILILIVVLLPCVFCLSQKIPLSAIKCQLLSNVEYEHVDTHTQLQNYLVKEDEVIDYSYLPKGEVDNSRPSPYVVSYSFEQNIKKANIYLIKDNIFNVINIYSADVLGNNASYTLDTLSVGSTYFYFFKAETSNNQELDSKVCCFKTEDSPPANIRVSGLANCRDIGGWHTNEGKIVKQGLIYRTSQYNDGTTHKTIITQDGINTMLNKLHVKSEIDFREDEESGLLKESVLGKEVQYFRIPMDYASLSDINTNKAKTQVKNIFDILCDSKNYPIAYHCAIGRDRTGFVTFLLNGYLGVSEYDLSKDYVFSTYGNFGEQCRYDKIQPRYVRQLKDLPGDTLSNKIEYYLLLCGLSNSQLNQLRNNLLEC